MARPTTSPEQRQMLTLFGENLKAIRTSVGRSQAALGHAVGADQQYVREVEQGKVNVSVTRVAEFARELGVAPGALVDVLADD